MGTQSEFLEKNAGMRIALLLNVMVPFNWSLAIIITVVLWALPAFSFIVFNLQLNITSCFISMTQKKVYIHRVLSAWFPFPSIEYVFCLKGRIERNLEDSNQNKLCFFLKVFPKSWICVISVLASGKFNLLRTYSGFIIPKYDGLMSRSMLFRKTRLERTSFWPSSVQDFALCAKEPFFQPIKCSSPPH